MSNDLVQIVNLFVQQVDLDFVRLQRANLVLKFGVAQAKIVGFDFLLLTLLGEQFELNSEVSESLFQLDLFTSNEFRRRTSTDLLVELSNELFDFNSEIGVVAFAFDQFRFILFSDK